VYDLGADGSEAPRRVAECADFLADAPRALGGREVFGRGAGDRKGAAIVHMSPIPPTESHRLHLVTVTADGRRVYWAAASARASRAPAGPRPDRLRAEVARQAMPSAASAARAGGAHHAPARGLQVAAACYASGALLLAEAAQGEARTRLFLLTRDLTVPPVGTATGAHVAVQGLRESVVELESPVAGEACALRAVPPAPAALPAAAAAAPSVRDALTAQNFAPPPRFVLVTAAGVLELAKLRPADVLAALLTERAPAKVEQFFQSYGAPEAAAMCVQLAAAGPPAAPAAAVAAAKDALEDARLCGEPELRDADAAAAAAGAGAAAGYGADDAGTGTGGFDMGAVVPAAEPVWSGAHRGVCLYASRLLRPLWDEPVAAPPAAAPALLRCALPLDALAALEDRLRALDAFLEEYSARRRARRAGGGALYHAADAAGGGPAAKRQRLEDAARQEAARGEGVRSLVGRAADACFLLRALAEHNLGRLAARLDDPGRAALRALRFRDWVASADGEAVATQLISVLVSEHLAAGGGASEDLSAALQGGCPSFFKDDDRLFYNASGLLRRAAGAAAAADREALTREAAALLARVPLACDLAQVAPQLAALRALDAVVDLAARVSRLRLCLCTQPGCTFALCAAWCPACTNRSARAHLAAFVSDGVRVVVC
jgi:nuclear pore complex protein Nup155